MRRFYSRATNSVGRKSEAHSAKRRRWPVDPPYDSADRAAAQLAEVDAYVQAQMATQHIPGLTLVVTLNGQPALEKGYGVGNIASSTPVTPATVFRIGSITKQFTATAIMLLVQDGRISLDDKVSRYQRTAPASWNAISIRHLLQHTSGLQRDLPESRRGPGQVGRCLADRTHSDKGQSGPDVAAGHAQRRHHRILWIGLVRRRNKQAALHWARWRSGRVHKQHCAVSLSFTHRSAPLTIMSSSSRSSSNSMRKLSSSIRMPGGVAGERPMWPSLMPIFRGWNF
jgi:hypothetical protein